MQKMLSDSLNDNVRNFSINHILWTSIHVETYSISNHIMCIFMERSHGSVITSNPLSSFIDRNTEEKIISPIPLIVIFHNGLKKI